MHSLTYLKTLCMQTVNNPPRRTAHVVRVPLPARAHRSRSGRSRRAAPPPAGRSREHLASPRWATYSVLRTPELDPSNASLSRVVRRVCCIVSCARAPAAAGCKSAVVRIMIGGCVWSWQLEDPSGARSGLETGEHWRFPSTAHRLWVLALGHSASEVSYDDPSVSDTLRYVFCCQTAEAKASDPGDGGIGGGRMGLHDAEAAAAPGMDKRSR